MIKSSTSGVLMAGALVLIFAATGHAFLAPERPRLPNFDKRPAQPNAEAPSAEQRKEIAQLRMRLPEAGVEFGPVTGAPKWVTTDGGFLSGSNGLGKAISAGAILGLAADDPHRATKAFLREHRALFGHGPEALEKARVNREFVSGHNGLRTTVWEQHVEGVALFEGLLISHVSKAGELVNLSSQFIPDPEGAANRGFANRAAKLSAPDISARQAVAISLRNTGEENREEQIVAASDGQDSKFAADPEKRQRFKGPAHNGLAEARLVWLPVSKDLLRLCWEIVFTSRARGEMFRVLVDAQTGEPWLRHCLTDYISDASYRVFSSDSPSPFSPGLAAPASTQPPLTSSALITLPALDTNASPAGWIDDGANETLGNNVDAHTDRNGDDSPDLPRPHGSPDRVFDFSMDLTGDDPTNYASASVVQLFYLCNWMHDKLYNLGFTEAAGNFQSNNFGLGGFGSDALQADAQDGSGFNNANMSTPSDGAPPRLQMFLFNGPSPRRDGDLDAEVVLHEYTHGLSNRRIGGGVGISALQSQGMGEGWSDFYALALLSHEGDDVNGNYAMGAYVSLKLSPSFQQNYYFGIRRYPYTTDLNRNPLTLKDIDPVQISSHSDVPKSTAVGGGGAGEVHNQGEVWCVTLWDARANLINKCGWSNGNQLILQLVTDAMNLSPPNPNFLQARDAILQADLVNNGGTNRFELWQAFAKRGMGFSATCPGSFTTAGVHEAFDLPDDLRIAPSSSFTSSGPLGGPFSPKLVTLTLSNVGTNPLPWSLVNTSAWLNISPNSGSLDPGSTAVLVNADVDASATNLPAGIYTASVLFTNLNSQGGQSRQFILRVGQPEYFTEIFDASDNDLAFSSFTFTPDRSASFYTVCRDAATEFPTDPAGGTNVSLTDDSFAQVTLPSTNTVSLYSRHTNVFFIGSNGYLTFNSGDNTFIESASSHFNRPRISGLFHDLNPGVGGAISWKKLDDRVAVSYQNVPQYGGTTPNSFQIEMFFDGRLRLTYLTINCVNDLVGLSAGQGVPAGFVESDLSVSSLCPATPPLLISQPASQTVKPGSNVTLSVNAAGSAPLKFRWRKNNLDLDDAVNLNGSSSPALKLTNVGENDSGQYSVVVTNANGWAVSSNATLLVSALDHFVWSHIPSPQTVNVPFVVTIRAQDENNATIMNYSGSAALSAVAAVTPATSTSFAQGFWTGSVTITQATANLVLRADDAFGHSGQANAIQVVNAPVLETESYGNVMLLIWPAGAPGLALETSTNLWSDDWVRLSSPVQIGDQCVLPAPMSDRQRFYRLHYTPK